jgi:fluoride exporter
MDEHRRPPALGAMALGGGLGTAARYGVAQVIHATPGSFPWPTFWTNLSGSFALGVFLAVVLQHFPPRRYLRPFVAVGFLGAYTTYSTFAVETVLLVRDGRAVLGLGYALASLAGGVAMAGAGMWWARVLRGDG